MQHATMAMVKQLEAERGPRWLIYGTIRQGEFIASYADTADAAEWLHAKMESDHYRQVRTVPPAGGVDLAKLGRERNSDKRTYGASNAALKTGVLAALADGRSESEVARTAGIDRMTVRKWAGKD
jgi:hypothetical protein